MQKLGVKVNFTLTFKKLRRNRRGNGDMMMHQLLARLEKLLYNGPNMGLLGKAGLKQRKEFEKQIVEWVDDTLVRTPSPFYRHARTHAHCRCRCRQFLRVQKLAVLHLSFTWLCCALHGWRHRDTTNSRYHSVQDVEGRLACSGEGITAGFAEQYCVRHSRSLPLAHDPDPWRPAFLSLRALAIL